MIIFYLRTMNYKYRVTLEGIKGFYRLYSVSGSNTLYTFHKQLRSDLEFPVDQPILFKAFDENGSVAARYALIDLGDGTVDDVTVEKTVRAGIVSFVYFYDVKAKKYVIVTLEGESETRCALPTVLETKGPLPIDFERGYVAFEDLPKDRRRLPGDAGVEGEDDEIENDLDDEEGDDDDREEEEVVYEE